MADQHPTPGSAEALHLGCRCPIVENRHGKGLRQFDDGRPAEFATDAACPIHGDWYRENDHAQG